MRGRSPLVTIRVHLDALDPLTGSAAADSDEDAVDGTPFCGWVDFMAVVTELFARATRDAGPDNNHGFP